MNKKILFGFIVLVGIFGIIQGANIRTTDDINAINAP